ncbi:MAG: magnesium transporter [Provencibacterium sp.]|jgi:magnesium transporter|nr:magnesium transporter [Provencibacterium sp.]
MDCRIQELLSTRRFGELKQLLSRMNEVDIAEQLDSLSQKELLLVFRLLPKETAADTFSYMESDVQQSLISAMDDVELRAVLDELALDDTVDMLEEMPASVVKRVLQNCDMQYRASINQFLRYPEDSAGSLMTIEYVDLKGKMTAAEAFEHIRATGIDKETIYTCYVTDKNRLLCGVVTVKDLLLAKSESRVEELMERNVISVRTLDDREQIALLFGRYDFLSLPVVDNENRLVGIITVDDAIDALQEENTEDFEKMAALAPGDESYLKTPVLQHAKRRIIWLLVLMLSAAVTGTMITHYQNSFAVLPLLVAFIPMLMDTGGNCGSQSSTLIIRGMALDELHPRDLGRILWKEIRVALLVGSALAVVNSMRILLQYHNPLLALTIAVTLMCTVCIAKCLGCILPITAKRLGADPAIMASPIITTLVDACSIFIYFNIAKLILRV